MTQSFVLPRIAAVLLVTSSLACGSKETPEPAAATEPQVEAPAPAAAPEPEAPKGPALEAPADPNEACARVLVVSYQGAQFAPEGVTRDKIAAQARAAELRKDPRAEQDFAALAAAESDGKSSAPRGGIMGTYTKDAWPEAHAALKEPLFALQVNETAKEPIEAPYGYVLLQRCKVEKRHARHVLVRYKGAKNAGKDVKRSIDDARARAIEVQQKLSQGGDFADVVKKYSEDASKERGGDLGSPGRGLLAPAFEDALFKLKVGELSTVVETEFGFHVIQRLPDESAAP